MNEEEIEFSPDDYQDCIELMDELEDFLEEKRESFTDRDLGMSIITAGIELLINHFGDTKKQDVLSCLEDCVNLFEWYDDSPENGESDANEESL